MPSEAHGSQLLCMFLARSDMSAVNSISVWSVGSEVPHTEIASGLTFAGICQSP